MDNNSIVMIDSQLQNELKARFNPDGSSLRALQNRMVEMLKWFDEFCQSNNIRYWISCGTCLGAVRHGGFIPWDDDVDVEMSLDDYGKFCTLFRETDDYVFQTKDNDFFYTAPFGKLRDKHSVLEERDGIDVNYKFRGIFIDIFPVEEASPLLAKLAVHYRWKLTLFAKKSELSNRQRKTFDLCKKIFYFLIPVLRFLGKMSLFRRQLCCYGTGFLNEHRDRADVKLLSRVMFEGIKVSAPGDCHSYLMRLYGDYLKLPDLNDIHVHASSITFCD